MPSAASSAGATPVLSPSVNAEASEEETETSEAWPCEEELCDESWGCCATGPGRQQNYVGCCYGTPQPSARGDTGKASPRPQPHPPPNNFTRGGSSSSSCSTGRRNFARGADVWREVGDDEVEHVGWLNWVLEELWGNAEQAVATLLEKEVLPKLQENLPRRLNHLHLRDLSLGDSAPVLGPVKVYRKRKQKHLGIELDVGLQWQTGARARIEVANLISFGLAGVNIIGEVSLVFKPVLTTLPILGGLQIFMINKPRLELQFTGIAAVADFPWVDKAIRKALMQVISDLMVLPNRLYCHWIYGREHETDLAAMRCPMPEGVIRIGVVEARGLCGKDLHFLSAPTSDPYATVQVGNVQKKTPTRQKTLEPVWGADGWMDFLFYNRRQEVVVRLWDDDKIDRLNIHVKNDDFLGHLGRITISNLLREPDRWWPLSLGKAGGDDRVGSANRSAGEVRIQAMVFDFQEPHAFPMSPTHLSTSPCAAAAKGAQASSVALLTVNIRRLRGLPKNKAGGAVMKLQIEGHKLETKPAEFVEAMQDLVYDWHTKELDPVTQRLAECLREKNMSLQEIALLAGTEPEQLERVMKQNPSFTTRWDEGFHVLLKDPGAAKLDLALALARESSMPSMMSKDHHAIIELSQPYMISQLFMQPNMEFEGLLVLSRRGNQSSHRVEDNTLHPRGIEGPFDLQIHLKLWGMKEDEVDDREERRRERLNLSQTLYSLAEPEEENFGGCPSPKETHDGSAEGSAKSAEVQISPKGSKTKSEGRCRRCCMCCRRRRRSPVEDDLSLPSASSASSA